MKLYGSKGGYEKSKIPEDIYLVEQKSSVADCLDCGGYAI